jgi:uncharacterized protein (TIGR00369 family)
MSGYESSALTGLEVLRAVAGSEDRPPHIGDLLDMEIVSIEYGLVTIALVAEPRFANYSRTMHGGVCATLLDSVMGCAAHSVLPAGSTCSAIELKVNFVRAVPLDGDRLVGQGRVIHAGRKIVTSEGTVRDSRGRIVAHGSSTCLVSSLEGLSAPAPAAESSRPSR